MSGEYLIICTSPSNDASAAPRFAVPSPQSDGGRDGTLITNHGDPIGNVVVAMDDTELRDTPSLGDILITDAIPIANAEGAYSRC